MRGKIGVLFHVQAIRFVKISLVILVGIMRFVVLLENVRDREQKTLMILVHAITTIRRLHVQQIVIVVAIQVDASQGLAKLTSL